MHFVLGAWDMSGVGAGSFSRTQGFMLPFGTCPRPETVCFLVQIKARSTLMALSDKSSGISKLSEVSSAALSQAFGYAVPGRFLLRMNLSLPLHTLQFVGMDTGFGSLLG